MCSFLLSLRLPSLDRDMQPERTIPVRYAADGAEHAPKHAAFVPSPTAVDIATCVSPVDAFTYTAVQRYRTTDKKHE